MSETHVSTIAGVGTAHLSYPDEELSDSDSDGDSFVINGIALGVGDVTVGQSGTKKFWPAEELERAAETLEGKDLVRDHINTSEGKVGTVTEATYMEDVGVVYEAEVASHYDELAQDIKAGLMEVSVRAYHSPEEDLSENDDGALVVEDVYFDNLSVVTNGASPSNTAEPGAIGNILDSAPTVEASASFSGGQSTATLSRTEAVLSHDKSLGSNNEEAEDEDYESSEYEEEYGDSKPAKTPPEWTDGDLVQWQVNPNMCGKVVHNPNDKHIVMVDVHKIVDGELQSTGFTITAGYADIVEYDGMAEKSYNGDKDKAHKSGHDEDEYSMTSDDLPADPDKEYAMDVSPDHPDMYDSREDALDRANEIGLDDVHPHEFDAGTYYMPGEDHQEYVDSEAEKEYHDDEEYSTPGGSGHIEELAGVFSTGGTMYGIGPDEHDDDSTNHPENAKYPMTSCTGEDSIESAWNLRANGNYNIDQSTLESRIRSVAEDMDCDMSVVGEGSEENEQAAELVDASVDDYVQWDWSDGTAYGQVTERISEDGACRTVDGNERCADGDRDVLVIQQVDEDGTEQDQRVLKYDDDSSVSRWNMSEQSASTIEQAHEAAMDVEEASMDELDEVYSDWSDAVNMTASQLESWSDHPCASEASVDSNAVITRNMRLLETNKSDWDADDISDAKRTISFISRMSADGNKPESPKDGVNGCPSKWAISLLNWAFNPFDGMPDRPSEDEMGYDYVPAPYREDTHHHDTKAYIEVEDQLTDGESVVVNKMHASRPFSASVHYKGDAHPWQDPPLDNNVGYTDTLEADTVHEDVIIEVEEPCGHADYFYIVLYYLNDDEERVSHILGEEGWATESAHSYVHSDFDVPTPLSDLDPADVESMSADLPEEVTDVAGSRTTAVATTATLSGSTGESVFNSTETMIEYDSADIEELGDELDDPVVVEKDELEDMADKAEKAEDVEAELGALSEKLDEQDEATEIVGELSDEAVDMIESDTEVSVVEASQAEMFDEVQALYAEELAEHWPGSDAEELAEKFTPTELREKVEDHEDAELSASIEDSEPEPDAGGASEEELSGEGQDVEDAREEYAAELEAQGWDSQADKVRSGEIPIQD